MLYVVRIAFNFLLLHFTYGILESQLAEVMGVSVSAASALDRIATLTGAKEYDEATTEAEKALKSYPNNFDIVYRSALLYLELGKNTGHRTAGSRLCTNCTESGQGCQ